MIFTKLIFWVNKGFTALVYFSNCNIFLSFYTLNLCHTIAASHYFITSMSYLETSKPFQYYFYNEINIGAKTFLTVFFIFFLHFGTFQESLWYFWSFLYSQCLQHLLIAIHLRLECPNLYWCCGACHFLFETLTLHLHR